MLSANTLDTVQRRLPEVDSKAEATFLQTAGICLAFALLSCMFTGFVFGVSNNQFHLPIMERLYDEPQFAKDAFIQSLRFFSSGIWLFLRALPRFADGGYTLFLVLFFASRLLSFIGFVCCASLLGIVTLRERLMFCAIICLTALLEGNSFAGHGGLFVTFFSHSEIANGTILLALFFAINGRFNAALICAGTTFFVNAFMGAWVCVPLVLLALRSVHKDKTSLASLIKRVLPGAVCFAGLAAPVLYNALSNPELRAPIDFDFIAFLREWYGGHYLIDSNSPLDILMLLAVVVLGWLSFNALQGKASEFRVAFLGILAIYLIGVIAPYVAINTVIFKLHLLRTSAVVQLLAALGASALATKWLGSPDRKQAVMFGPSLLVCLCATKAVLPLAAVVVALASSWEPRQVYASLRPAMIGGLMLIVPWHYSQRVSVNNELTAAVSDWQALGFWARNTTPPNSLFLILTANEASLEKMSEADAQRTLGLSTAAAAFESAAHRRVWVDFLTGGMAVFQPSYYGEWHSRVSGVLALRSLSEKLKYAQRNGIDYIVEDCLLFDQSNIRPTFRSGSLCATSANATPS